MVGMMSPQIERRYALTKVSPGDYVVPSNDAQSAFRMTRSEGEGWDLWRWTDEVSRLEIGDWSRWECIAQQCATRAEAIAEAMRVSA
jgi:hypothetical protein